MSDPKNCKLHGRSFNGQCKYTESWCEGYCGGRADDEPIEQCKECKFNQFWEGE